MEQMNLSGVPEVPKPIEKTPEEIKQKRIEDLAASMSEDINAVRDFLISQDKETDNRLFTSFIVRLNNKHQISMTDNMTDDLMLLNNADNMKKIASLVLEFDLDAEIESFLSN